MKLQEMNPKSVAVFRALQLGDLLCSVPAFRALRKTLPNARICLIGLPWARAFVRRFNFYFDDFLEFPGYPGLPEIAPQADKVPSFFNAAQAKHFDLVLQMHGSGSYVNSITALLGAAHCAGFFKPEEYCPEPGLFMEYPESGSEIQRHLSLMEFLGAPAQGDHLEFPVLPEDEEEWEKLRTDYGLKTRSFACVHPGARLPSRRWPAQRFAAVADALAARGVRILLTGSAEERVLTKNVAKFMRGPSVNLAGITSLGGLAALLRHAKLLVSNDTGVSHLASALKVRSVVVACGSDPKRWAPLNRDLHHVISFPVSCRPCAFSDCPVGHECAEGISGGAVIREAVKVLEEEMIG